MSQEHALDRFTLRFKDAALERQYRDAEDAKAVRIMRVGIVGGMVLFAAACVALILFAPAAVRRDQPDEYIWIALAVVTAMGIACYVITWSAPFRRYPQPALAAFCAIAPLWFVAGLRYLPQDMVTQRGFMFVVLHIFTIYSLLRLRLVPAVVGGWGTVFVYVAAMKGWAGIDDVNLGRHFFWLAACSMWGTVICYQVDRALRREFASALETQRERARAEGLLLNILPAAIAQRLKVSRERIAEHAGEVTVLFADIVGFTPLSARKPAAELVELLDEVFTEFDELAARHGLEKIKTIGDAYMAVAGLPQPLPDHAQRAARMALAMVERVHAAAERTGEPLQVRVGLHSGPVVAGVIGRTKFSYDLWGDTVNTASRMESSGVPGAVHCTFATARGLDGAFVVQSRGLTQVKGKEPMETFLLAAGAGA